jgi:HlyD family secretion protein
VSEISNSSIKNAVTGSANPSDQAIDYEVTIQLLNAPPTTRPDFSATAKIVTDTRRNVLSIPIIALTVREDSLEKKDSGAVTLAKAAPEKQVGKRDVEGVFSIGADNKVTFKPVKVGIAGEKYFEVLSGVKQDEKIVGGTYQAIRELKDGSRVKSTPEKKKDEAKKS